MEWRGAYQWEVAERREMAQGEGFDLGPAWDAVGNAMVENCVGGCVLPVGVNPHMHINGKRYVVPMCTEEPSVVAAACSASKLVGSNGGFKVESGPSTMIGQLHLVEIEQMEQCQSVIEKHANRIIEEANTHCPRMVARGGGVMSLELRALDATTLAVHFHVDVRDAMGANAINTIMEGVAPHLEARSGHRCALRILSNYCPARITTASCRIPVDALAYKGIPGQQVAARLVEANHIAEIDMYRAVTHNKGILNGVDAVAVATGQDWRAIEAAAHAHASIQGRYAALTRYSISDGALQTSLSLPLAVGVVGGATTAHPSYKAGLAMLGVRSAGELAGVLAAAGLAQNLGALRALVTEGIQRGHMALHKRK